MKRRPAEPSHHDTRRTGYRSAAPGPLPLRGRLRWQKAVTSGVTETPSDQAAAVWHQADDLPDPVRHPAYRAGRRNFQIPGRPPR